MSENQPKKIAVLGGGLAAMASVYELTSQPDWEKRYDITIYQLGWRIGGKGASGRNPDIAQRIEEHGLHVWFGFYDNAFNMMKRVYSDNQRPLQKPLSKWNEAFKPSNFVVLEDHSTGKWQHWPFDFPPNNLEPGTETDPPSVGEYMRRMLALMKSVLMQNNASSMITPKIDRLPFPLSGLSSLLKRVIKLFISVGLDLTFILVEDVEKLLHKLEKNSSHYSKILKLLDKITDTLWKHLEHKLKENDEAIRLWILFDLGLSVMRGVIKDEVIFKGFDVINDLDFREWLKKHGATEITLNSGLVDGVYVGLFSGHRAYTLEAGTALRGALRLALSYRGAVFYRMQAGMGDVVFTPIYEVLKKRGVKFEFFHKVKSLNMSEDEQSIDSIDMKIQATTKEGKEYQPLIDVKGLPCWPSYPLYDQLEQGEEIKEKGINLETYYTDWKAVKEIKIKKGIDFDEVIQGISVGALPTIAKDIIDKKPAWKQMVEKVTTTPTQCFQLWLKPDVAGLGWKYWKKDAAMDGTYVAPFDTWADMSELIIREAWPDSDEYPNNISYILGPLTNVKFPPFKDTNFPKEELEKMKIRAKAHMNQNIAYMWPDAIKEGNFNWDLLVDLKKQVGEKRFDSQYFRVNLDPTELYVLSEANNSKYRLKTDESGFNNMYITGTWIQNGFNVGCVEAGVMAGMQTARAISREHFEKKIVGETDIVED